MTDDIINQIADYAAAGAPASDEAFATARLCLMDSLGCAMLALDYPACVRMLGPVVSGATLPGGARVPGMNLELDPVQAAFNFGTMIRWLDYNDTWLAAEWGHPSDNLGAILMTADWLGRREPEALAKPRDSSSPASASGSKTDTRTMTVRHVLNAMIQAYEIQGILALENAFNRVGLDHVLLVRIASTAVATKLLGGSRDQIAAAVSQAWLDGGALRTYRHAPNTGSRKSWAAGDATSRAVKLALWTMAGEPGYATPLTTPTWGFQDSLFRGKPITLAQPLGSYVMEHVLFKVSYPAEFHAQTAVEAAVKLSPLVRDRFDRIQKIRIETQEAGVRIITKSGPLKNPADRDHCLQYMTAAALIHGTLAAEHYEESHALDPRVDFLRNRMEVVENAGYSRDYLDPTKRSIANSVQVSFDDGTATERVEVEYPLGHKRRRVEAKPELIHKFRHNAGTRLPAETVSRMIDLFDDASCLDAMPVGELVEMTLP